MKKKLVLFICYVLLEIAEYGQSVELECEKEGFAVVPSENCGVYYYCVKSANDELYAVKLECPLGEGFSLLKLKCIPDEINECGKLPEIPIEDPILSDEFVCPSSGRFPNVKSPDCKSYYMCSNVLVPVLNNCPSTTIFSWVSMKCVVPTDFTCPNTMTTTTEATTIPNEVTTSPTGFVCITEGRFADPQSINCKSYYLCVTKIDGNIDAILSQCPSTTVFSPGTQKCVVSNQYECPTTTSPTDPSTTEAATTTTTEESTSETSEPNAFVCTDVGRFSDPVSTDCTTYYLCSISTDGIYEALLNQCPSTTIFSPIDQKCLETGYKCSAGTTAMTDEPSTIESTTSYTTDSEVATQDPSTSEPTETVELTTASSTTDTENQTTDSESTAESTTDTVTTPYPPSFICTIYGRFSDPESTDCKGYYLCTENTEGIFQATLNRCPSVTIFDPQNGKCVQPTDYQCPIVETTTSELTDEPSTVKTTVPSTEAPTEPSTSEPSTPVLTTDSTIPTSSTSTTDEPTPDPSGEPFACTQYGRFPDPKSTDCKGYYLCTENTEGIFQATLNRCPSVTVFYPENGKCVQPIDYQCTAIEITTSEPTDEPSTVETTVPSTVAPTVTTPEPTTPVPTTQTPPPSETFVCTAVGRFPDPTSTDCKGYYLCSTTADGAYEAVLTQCPSITIFSAGQNRCVLMSQYQCPTAITTSTVEPTTVETTPSSTTSPGNFICTSIGRHPDPTQPDCSKYKYCLLTATNEFLEYTFNCPSGSYFNPLELRCSFGYSCPALFPTDIAEATTQLPRMATPFYCTSDGRFADPTSEGCDTYIMCLRTAVGNYLEYNFKCPTGSLFSPTEAKCSTSYLCI